jgi:hypothetical protein
VQDLFVYPDAPEQVHQNLERDRERAKYAFRWLASIPAEQFPVDCRGPYRRSLYDEFQLRYDSIEGELPARKPLGFAIGMCGRTMNAHYIDDMVVDGTQDSPYGWSKDTIPLIDD